MATGMESNMRLSCSLCKQPFRGREPKLLPCSHTFCLLCLERITAPKVKTQSAVHESDDEEEKSTSVDEPNQARSENEYSSEGSSVESIDPDDNSEVFECPTCRAFIVVPLDGVREFKTNYFVDIDDSPPVTEPVMCDTCEEKTATHECGDCRRKMCAQCCCLHAMHAKGHHMRYLQPSAVGESSPTVVKTNE